MEEDFPEDDDEDDALEPSSSKFKFGALCDQSTDLLCSRSYRCGCFSSFTSSFIFFFDDHDGKKDDLLFFDKGGSRRRRCCSCASRDGANNTFTDAA